ncbi:hypothetical protein FACS1894184_04330 [Clostridia bacterium]|nr:hypothetical protein FACS1894184_04330 [Clostridia bacterium]
MKRTLAILISLALLLTLTGGAYAVVESDLTTVLGDFSQYGSGNMDKYDPPIDMTVGMGISLTKIFPEGESYEDNVWSRAFSDELGVNLKLAFATPDYNDKINAMIAAGDIPDFMQVNKSQLLMLADSGLIRDDLFTAYDENAGASLRLLVEGIGGEAGMASATFNGNLMAYPAMNSSPGEETPMLWLRTDWMEKLGLSDPQNYADLRAIIEAFATQDPDGNGVNDTYGITFTKNPWDVSYAMDGFANIFGGFPKTNFWVPDPSDPNKVVYGAFQPQVKTALAELADLYSKGYIDKEFAVKDGTGSGELIASGKLGLTIGAVWITNSSLYPSVDNDPNADWHAVALPGLESPTTKITGNYPIGSYFVFNANFEHPEAFIRIVNLYMHKAYGPDATLDNYDKYVEGISGSSGYTPFQIYPWGSYLPAIKNEMAADLISKGIPSDEIPMWGRPFAKYVEAYEAGDLSMWRWYRFFGPDGGHLITGKYIREGLVQMNAYYGPTTPTMADNMSLITQLVDEMVVKIVMGEAPVDDFEKFYDQAIGLGLQTITDECNDWLAQSIAQ